MPHRFLRSFAISSETASESIPSTRLHIFFTSYDATSSIGKQAISKTRNTGTPERGTPEHGTLKILNLLKIRNKLPGCVKLFAGKIIALNMIFNNILTCRFLL
jgi:hypothetical protein